ncbi:SDR family NAD(P)-dependent oxidoreductase [Actibacterium sp. 188UL27-1]|uniref:SDR family NAD(P)-dependent oxidoreductase n=1 Tax=Actibacterium sp. 188UL27-1 TaxID=2786961 RepID=UPI00195B611E|nr:SDR family NAD(P)-dependent oxidoreductase [Actibacterium sp. 188UL27-1]MBM7069787.1 SDR family NAD(P)-dependent oxidoreductase [Actibacterium sp. 188UL27-1]
MKKTLLITGSSSGIGYDAAHGMTRRGWRVFATCRNPDDCARLRDEGLESVTLDVADPNSIQAALAEILNRTGGTLGALFNNAAFGLPGAVEDLPTDGLRSIFETNLFGLHHLTRELIPVMRKQEHGRIIQNSSVLGFAALKWRGAYVATKHALEGLTDVMRLELADTPIKVVLIQPGPVTSRIRENSIPHFERWIDWKASPRKAQYEETLLKRLYQTGPKDRFELPAAAVTRKLHTALTHPNPKPRYFVTTPTYIMAAMERILPVRAADKVLQKI